MGIREAMNERPAVATAATLCVIAIALGVIVFQLWPTSTERLGISQMFYSVDDGETYFPAEGTRYAPFQHNGREAVRVYVFSCDENKTKFVGYLERLTPDAKRRLEEAARGQAPIDRLEAENLILEGSEVKRKGEKTWTRRDSPDGEKIIFPPCPNSQNGHPTIFLPGD